MNKKLIISDIMTELVKMAEIKVVRTGKIWAVLGSCIGLAMYDEFRHISGFAHIMLPDHDSNNDAEGKYADLAVPALLNQMILNGARRGNIRAKIVGGAKMFAVKRNSPFLNMGARIEKVVREMLERENIKIVSSLTGGTKGRKLEFDSVSGKIIVETFGEDIKVI